MSLGEAIKDPQAQLDYEISWASWLATDEEITDVEWTVPDGLTEVEALTSDTTTTTTVGLSGGTAGCAYTVVCQVTTNANRIDQRSIIIRVVER